MSRTGAAPSPLVLRQIRQVIDGDQTVEIEKSYLIAALPDGGSLALVRKRLSGAGPASAILLVHGFAQNRYCFHMPRRSFSAYLAARGLDVFNLDLRGHGRSRALGAPLPRSFEDYALLDIPAALEAVRSCGHQSVFLLGFSLGGAVVYAAAPRAHGLVRGVVTVSGVFRWGGGAPALARLSRLLDRSHRLRRAVGLTRSLPLRLDVLGRAMARRADWLYAPTLPLPAEGWAPGSIEPELLRCYVSTAFDRTSGAILAQMGHWAASGRFCDASGRIDYAQAWAASGIPVLVIAGNRDRLAHPDLDVRPAYDCASAQDRSFRCFGPDPLDYGHVDLIAGDAAPRTVWPCIAGWLEERA